MTHRFEPKKWLIDTLYYTAGSILYALGLYTFALHANFAPGGVSGLALILNHFSGWPIGLLSLALNVPIVLVCARVVGRVFILKSIWAMIVNTIFLDLVFPLFPTYTGNPLLAAMFTGVLMGAGLGIIYMRGSSTGGSDFVIMTIKKLRPHISVGKISLATDVLVILLGGVVFGNVDAVLYGIISSFAATMMMDSLLYGAGSGKLAMIVTVYGSKIAEAISVEVGRGATILEATGAFTGEGREVLLCACAKNEIYKVRTAARAIDPSAMIMITEANEVFGEGFTPPNIPGNEPPEATTQ